ncbi:hypothetical protein AKO1_005009 [Acrasis kona]|uniref:Uncharacterized protein n=1 Tax=Acrasis kona TaxID=1008807 RepID=A0AAW2Z3M8_9EUKA
MWDIKRREIKKVQKEIEEDIRLRNKMVKSIHRSFAKMCPCPYMNQTILSIPDQQENGSSFDVSLYALLKSLEDESYAATSQSDDTPICSSPTKMEIVTTANHIISATSTTGMQVGKVLITNLGAASHFVSVAGVALSVVTVPIDIYTLAKESTQLRNGTVSEISEKIRSLSKELRLCSIKLYQKYDQEEVDEIVKQNEGVQQDEMDPQLSNQSEESLKRLCTTPECL